MKHEREKRPAPEATGNGPNEKSPSLDRTDGEAAKQLAFDLFKAHRAEQVAEAKRLMVELARSRGEVTIDDVRERMEIPAEYDPRWLGAVPGILAWRGILRHAGYVRSIRPVAHAREIKVWKFIREPRPGELGQDDGTGAAGSKRPDRPRHRQPAGTRVGHARLFPKMKSPYRDPGDASIDRSGRRRR